MTNKLKEAIEVLRGMPKAEQETAAQAIMDYAAHDTEMRLSDEQVAEIERRIASPSRKFLAVAQARKRLRRFGV
jgi:hypothetical protein